MPSARQESSLATLVCFDFPITYQPALIHEKGSGSILDALRITVPIVVVPNPDLLDNHQVELAEELSRQGYVVHGRLE